MPLHVLYIPRLAVAAGVGHAPSSAHDVYSDVDQDASDTVRFAEDIRRLRAGHEGLSVSEQVIRHGCHRPERELLDRDDILVTSPAGYLELVGQTELEEHVAARVPVPVVFVPDRVASGTSEQRVLLLTGPRFFATAASFAFAAAADLGMAMDVVRLPATYDGDYYHLDTEPAPHALEPRLRAELAKLQARFPGVPCDIHVLRARPWSALRAMTSAAHLAVLGVGAGCGVDVRAMYDLGTCPVAAVPNRYDAS
jgi:hypothetical protein